MNNVEKSMAINGKIVQIRIVAGKTHMDLLVFQLKEAHLYGSIGHSGHDNFPSGMQRFQKRDRE